MKSGLTIRHTFILLLAGLLLGAAANPPKEEKKPRIDPKAEEVVRRFCDFIRQADKFHVNATMDWRYEDRQGAGRNVDDRGFEHMGSQYDITMEKPHRFALSQKGGDVGATVVSDGQQMFTYIPHREAYALDDAPQGFGPIDDVLAMAAELTNMPGIGLVRTFLREDPYTLLMDGVEKAEHLGTERVDASLCDHVKLSQGDSSWEIWVDSGKEPVLTRYATALPKDATRIGDAFYNPRGDAGIDVRVNFRDWKINGKMRDTYFKYKLPKKTQEAETALQLKETYPPHPLLGKKAPKVKLALLDGGEFDLSDHKGKEIVVLDFWATWCGPCTMAMPGLIEVTDAYKDQGVRFYAVNQREGMIEINAFLKKQKLSCTVALDSEGGAGVKYEVRGIPQTVIIGKDGTVQAVHQGYSPDLKQKLTEELKTLLAGEKLAVAKK